MAALRQGVEPIGMEAWMTPPQEELRRRRHVRG
jgi:hypothetical protein